MKKLLSALSVFVFVFAICLNANAQTANTYVYSTSTGGALEDMTGATVLLSAPNDDTPSLLTTFPGGFTFPYETLPYTQFSATPDGFLKLGSPVATAQFTNAITSTTNRPKIFPLWDDLALGTSAGGGNVSYKLVGVTPNQRLVIQWFATVPRNTTGAANSTFQVWLYENGRIDFVYGTVGVAPSSSVGINSVAANATNFESVTISSNTMSTVTANNSNAAAPASGRVYTFNPPPPPTPNDVGISAVNFGAEVISAGKCYNFSATVTNYGTAGQTVIPVYYKIDGGSAVGPVNTVGPIAPNGGTEVVTFNGALGYCGLTPGTHTFTVYTDLAPPSANRAPVVVNLTVLAKITSLPYLQDWTSVDGFSVLTTAVFGTTALWTLNNATIGPNGAGTNPAVFANFYNGAAGRQEILRTREFDFTGVTNPLLHFYVGYRTYTGLEPDRLQVMVSTDHGLTFFPATTAYNKTHLTNPSLATLIPSSTAFNPAATTNWRHETVDLSNVGNAANVVIGFVATSAFGNNCWIDDIIVTQPSGLCTSIISPAPFTTSVCKITLDFTATPRPAPLSGNNLDNQSSAPKSFDKSMSSESSFPVLEGDATVASGLTTDNPTGGTAYVTQYYNNNPGQVINANPGNTNQNGSTNTPDVVYWQNAHWFRVTYDGNDQTGYATYNISFDIADYGFTAADAANMWILKRADQTSNWNVVTTTSTGTVIKASGLTNFCDFAFGDVGGAQPVELASFVSSVNGNSVTLNWATSSETNNSGFDIERSSNGTWSKVGTVTGNGTTTSTSNYSFTDRNVASGTYSYRLKQVDFNGNFEYFNLNNEVNVGIPAKFELSQNYPNPFNPSTSINFNLPFDAKVSIKVFDLSGKEVATLVNGAITAGYHSVDFNASNLSSGVYFYRINAEGSGNNFVATKKMSLIK